MPLVDLRALVEASQQLHASMPPPGEDLEKDPTRYEPSPGGEAKDARDWFASRGIDMEALYQYASMYAGNLEEQLEQGVPFEIAAVRTWGSGFQMGWQVRSDLLTKEPGDE